MNLRIFFLGFFFVLIYGLAGFRLYQLQIQKNQAFFNKVQAREELASRLELRRGQIFFTDRYNKSVVVAFNKDRPIIFAAPREIQSDKDLNLFSGSLASVVGISEEALKSKILGKPKSAFEVLVKEPTEDQIKSVKDLKTKLKLKSVDIQNQQYRYYPFEASASHLIGFVGVNEEHDRPLGLYGLEKFYDSTLSKGEDLFLTIDKNIQAQAEQILLNLVQRFEAAGGTIVVEEPITGKILALVNEPSFDPNEYGKSPIKNFLNPAAQYIYEPGSVFKPLTMAAGIDSGVLTPETAFVDTGSVILNGKKIQNWDLKAHGRVTMTNVIEQSINTGAIYAEKLIGNQKFLEYVKKFGFGKKTGIDLPDETTGSIKNLEKKDARAIDFATASFGQGTAATPLQLISAFSSLANGGLLMRPYVNAELKPEVLGRTVGEETAKKVAAMMESAVVKARVAAIPEYRVAGKTGTAQIPNFKTGGYTEEFIHTFIGFAPVSQARFAISIKLEKPNATLAGLTVVPAFNELARYIINYYNIPPDQLPPPQQ